MYESNDYIAVDENVRDYLSNKGVIVSSQGSAIINVDCHSCGASYQTVQRIKFVPDPERCYGCNGLRTRVEWYQSLERIKVKCQD